MVCGSCPSLVLCSLGFVLQELQPCIHLHLLEYSRNPIYQTNISPPHSLLTEPFVRAAMTLSPVMFSCLVRVNLYTIHTIICIKSMCSRAQICMPLPRQRTVPPAKLVGPAHHCDVAGVVNTEPRAKPTSIAGPYAFMLTLP